MLGWMRSADGTSWSLNDSTRPIQRCYECREREREVTERIIIEVIRAEHANSLPD